MTNTIVEVNVTQTVAPIPSTLQSTGALISQGGTTLADNGILLLTQLSDLTAHLAAPLAITSITRTSTTATVTTAAPHGVTTGIKFLTVIAGSDIVGYNGTFLATSTGVSTFTYTVASTLTTPATGSKTYTPPSVAELVAMATTFFAQGSKQAVYVLELGTGEAAAGVTALAAYITANPNSNYTPGSTGYFYSYLVPVNWADESTYITFLANYRATTSKTYFFTTMSITNYDDFSVLDKDAIGLVPSPDAPATEFSCAALFFVALAYAPSSTNRVTPFSFSYLFGVTPWSTSGNTVFLALLRARYVNYIGTGAEGGITTAILLWGTTLDGRGFTYWYSVDAVQINIDIDIANAVINGSNNPANPLYYNQDGIDRLQGVGAGTLSRMISYGLALGTVVQTALSNTEFQTAYNSGAFNGKLAINAEPFLTYSAENPSDYRLGKYGGFSVVYITQNGFINIIFNINVTDFVTNG